MSDSPVILTVKDLAVRFENQTVLQKVSFILKSGEAVAIIGPNGSGKTVLLRALLKLVPCEGTVEWTSDARIGYVPQKFFIERRIPLVVREFFYLKADRFWFPSRTFKEHIGHELALVGLNEEILSRPLGQLSGGQLQRVLIAWAMLNHPNVLLFDEPTTGIDAGAEETIYNLLHHLQEERGIAVILVSHDLNIVYRYAQGVVCLNKQMVCYGTPQEVLNPQDLEKLYGGGTFFHHAPH